MRTRLETSPWFLCILAAVTMAYGWGYRGVTGSERGAMAAGAMLGLALVLGTHRRDWHRRAAVISLFAAIGWAWGGSFSYMEQQFYALSDSFPDVLFGYTVLFFLGGLWAGIGGAVLGMAFTLSRSQLQRFTYPILAIGAAFLFSFILFFFFSDLREPLRPINRLLPNSGDWFAALLILLICGIWAIVRPREREEALLYVACAMGWWIGYLTLIKLPSLFLPYPATSLAPPNRLESWSGVLGILIVLMLYHIRKKNRAALMLSLYGLVGGGFAFPLAVFVRHPVRVEWGPFGILHGAAQWKIAEESFGFFMGLAIALGVLRLVRGGLAPAPEDIPPKRLDLIAGLVILIGILWLNLRWAPLRWVDRWEIVNKTALHGIPTWIWFTSGGAVLAAFALYVLYLYHKDRLYIVPPIPYAKGAVLLIFIMWITAISAFVMMLPGAAREEFPLVDASFILMCVIVTTMLLSRSDYAAPAEADLSDAAPPGDPRWKVGGRYLLVWAAVPVFLLTITGLSMAMQTEPAGRLRFGPNAYWHEARMQDSVWQVTDVPVDIPLPVPFISITLAEDRTIATTAPDGTVDATKHNWRTADGAIWFDWLGQTPDHPEAREIQMNLQGDTMYLPWPPVRDSTHQITLKRVTER